MRAIILILFVLGSLSARAQGYFEGEIEYRYQFQLKSPSVDSTRFRALFGYGSTMVFKDGNFRHDYDGGAAEFNIYNRRDNRLYERRRGNDTIYWYDCSTGGNRAQEIKLSSDQKTVLGISCNGLIVQYPKYRKTEYYNSDSIKVDASWFSKYKRDDQDKVDAIEKSISLRIEYDFPKYLVISEATRINRQSIDLKVFEIPANAILQKMNY